MDALARPPKKTTGAAPWNQTIRRRLLSWFAKNARDLPWRRTSDLFAIWISEIMLQQTQVATVIGYFDRFVARFPTVGDLADADEQEVLRLWEGLGYYRRARQLHAAAKQIVAQHGGQFPRTFDEVMSLPGIGRYTAGAILSIGLGARLPILEANSQRLLCRLSAERRDVQSSDAQRALWQFAEDLLPARRAGDFNQALMELGATICTPRDPRCGECPLEMLCPTRAAGLQSQIPAPKSKKRYEEIAEAAVVVCSGDGRVLLRRCQEGERWAGLWDFPRVAAKDDNIRPAVKSLTGVTVGPLSPLAVLKHGVTRYRITLTVYSANAARAARHSDGETLRWLDPQSLDSLPLCTTGRKIARLLM